LVDATHTPLEHVGVAPPQHTAEAPVPQAVPLAQTQVVPLFVQPSLHAQQVLLFRHAPAVVDCAPCGFGVAAEQNLGGASLVHVSVAVHVPKQIVPDAGASLVTGAGKITAP